LQLRVLDFGFLQDGDVRIGVFPAGKLELGFTVADVEAFYRDMSAKGVLFSMPPKKQDFGGVLAQFVDSEGAHCSVGAEAA
jgi:uncharacterized glyoxalase superfamily protein PhnB